MSDLDKLIKERHSVRKYKSDPIDKNIVKSLQEFIKKCNEDSGLSMQLKLNDGETFEKYKLHYGKIYNANNYLILAGPKGKNLDEKIGYYGEKVVLKAAELGLNTCWVGAGYSRKWLNAKLGRGEKIVCIIALGYGLHNGKVRPSKSFDEVSINNDGPAWYKKGIEYALLAPTALNQQKFKFELLDDNTVSVKAGVGPFSKVDLGIVKYHFECGAGNNFKWSR